MKPTIIQLRGTNGTGKTTLARQFIRDPEVVQLGLMKVSSYSDGSWRFKPVVGSVSLIPELDPERRVCCVGDYSRPSGGMDGISSFASQQNAVEEAVEMGHHVVCEGILASTVAGSWRDFFLRMEIWLGDRPDHPGVAAREWLVNLYGRNELVHGAFRVDGERIDLRRVRCPILNVHGTEDHIVPPPCTTALEGRTSSQDYRSLAVPTGHIGVFVSERAREIVPGGVKHFLQDIAGPG